MYKKIIYILLGLFIINIYSLNAFYDNLIGKDFYNKKEYSKALEYFKKAGDKEGYYNIANSYYKNEKYKEAIKEYMSILGEEKNEINFNINHNIANSFYRIGELEKDNTKKISNWEESVKYYSNALNIKYDEQTKKNLEFVLNKIKQEKKKQEDKKDEDKNQEKKGNKEKDSNDTNTGESEKEQDSKSGKDSKEGESKEDSKGDSGDKSDNKDGKAKEDTKKQDGSNGEKSGEENKDGNTGENKEGQGGEKNQQSNELSEEQMQAIEQYEEALKEEQKNNADSFNKVYKKNTSNDPFSDFFNDPFFNNSLLNGGSNEKDW